MRRFFMLASLIGLGVTMAGCRDSVGNRCMETADCKSGLVCILPVGGTPQTGGRCEAASDLAAKTYDLTLAEPADAGEDASTESTDQSVAPTVDLSLDVD